MITKTSAPAHPVVSRISLADMPTAETAEFMWRRWSSGALPMLRATIRPETRITAANHAFVERLGYAPQDRPTFAQTVLQALQSYTEAIADATGGLPPPRLMNMNLKRIDGTNLSMSMLLVAHTGQLSREVSVVGVGLPSHSPSSSRRTIPLSSQGLRQ